MLDRTGQELNEGDLVVMSGSGRDNRAFLAVYVGRTDTTAKVVSITEDWLGLPGRTIRSNRNIVTRVYDRGSSLWVDIAPENHVFPCIKIADGPFGERELRNFEKNGVRLPLT